MRANSQKQRCLALRFTRNYKINGFSYFMSFFSKITPLFHCSIVTYSLTALTNLSTQCYLLPDIKKHNIMQTLVRSFGPALHNYFLFSCGPMEKIIAQVCTRKLW